MKCRFIYLLIFMVPLCLWSQDIHFSQYYFSPLSLNPANTGYFRGDLRFFANYRSQWRDIDRGYNSFSAGGDKNFYLGKRQIAAGLIFINDQSASELGVTKIFPSAAWHLKLAGFKLSLGLQPGLVIKSFNFSKHSFPNQLNWEKGLFDRSLPNNESGGPRLVYFDLNAGFVLSRVIGKVEPEIGASAFHINNPPESFFDNGKNRLPIRQNLHGAITLSITSSFMAKVHSMYGATTKVSDWVSGVQLEYVLNRNPFNYNSVFAGFMWRDGFSRNPDAGICTMGLTWGSYTFGFSYDVTVSQLRTSVNSRGAYEIAIIYKSKYTRLSKKVVPCERF